MPKRINTAQFTQALQRAFGFKGRYIPMLDELITPVYVLQDPAPSYATKIASGASTALEVLTGDFVHNSLANPPGSGIIVVLTGLSFQANLEDDKQIILPMEIVVTIQSKAQPANATSNGRWRDRRIEGIPAARLSSVTDTSGPVFPAMDRVVFASGPAGALPAILQVITADPRQPIAVLPANSFLSTDSNTAADAASKNRLRTNFHWLEIPESQGFGVGTPP